jgi:hypothetical protein
MKINKMSIVETVLLIQPLLVSVAWTIIKWLVNNYIYVVLLFNCAAKLIIFKIKNVVLNYSVK